MAAAAGGGLGDGGGGRRGAGAAAAAARVAAREPMMRVALEGAPWAGAAVVVRAMASLGV